MQHVPQHLWFLGQSLLDVQLLGTRQLTIFGQLGVGLGPSRRKKNTSVYIGIT